MKIALLAPFEEPVPPKKYGGTELVAYNLAEELTKMGHDVTLLASGDSQTSAKLAKCTPGAVRTQRAARNNLTRIAYNYQGLAVAIKLINEGKFDVVHNHIGWQALIFGDIIEAPIITTLHGTLADPTENQMYKAYKESAFISISDSQRRHSKILNYVGTVYNGIDIGVFDYSGKQGDYLAFLGRICPEKGPVYAIEIAKSTGHKLIIAAKIDPVDEKYFEEVIEPLVDGDQIQFIGEIDHPAKVELLKHAKALLSPLQWDEPFGLVNIEAMACGTPVIAINRGSMAEIIVDGKTGYLCSNVDEMVDRLAHLKAISRAACRKHIEANFSSRLMAERYLKAYQSLVATA